MAIGVARRSSNSGCEMTTPSADRQSTKKTRFLLTKQSKYGCFTCKQRRIKCDEERPSCLRCQRSGRVCAGYPPTPAFPLGDRYPTGSPVSCGSSDSDSSWTVAPVPSSVPGVAFGRPQQRHFVELGTTILGSDPFHRYGRANSTIYSTLVPQLSQLYPSVNAAAAAFGAAYNSAVLRPGDTLASDESTQQYGLALKMLQLELNRSEPQYAPLLLSSTLLAASETIQARQKGALAHVLGTFGILANRQDQTKLLPTNIGAAPEKPTGGLSTSNDIIRLLEHMCLSVDVLVATFAWGQMPNLPPRAFTETTFEPRDVDELTRELPILVHASLHFVAEASQETFLQHTDLSFDLVLKQGQVIAWLRKWLASFSELVETTAPEQQPDTGKIRHLHLLKAQCLSTLVAVSNISTTNQVSWDKYAGEFEEIVRCAEIVLDQAGNYLTGPATPLPPFCPCPGIIHPLFFTARKWRHSLTRRRAISLLRLTGFEGPFHGDFEADLATRFVEIEEARPFSMQLREDQVMTPADIPDWRRICSCWRLSEKYDFDERIIKFCRQRQVNSHSPLASKAAFPSDQTSNSRSNSPTDQPLESDNWEVWEETIHSFRRRPEHTSSSALTASTLNEVDKAHDWRIMSGELRFGHQILGSERLSRDPDWVKSAVMSGEWFNFSDNLSR